jgi:hypothetical protein
MLSGQTIYVIGPLQLGATEPVTASLLLSSDNSDVVGSISTMNVTATGWGMIPTQPGTLSHHPLLAILANFALHARLRRGAGSISGKIAF